jgi:hypothetical protein
MDTTSTPNQYHPAFSRQGTDASLPTFEVEGDDLLFGLSFETESDFPMLPGTSPVRTKTLPLPGLLDCLVDETATTIRRTEVGQTGAAAIIGGFDGGQIQNQHYLAKVGGIVEEAASPATMLTTPPTPDVSFDQVLQSIMECVTEGNAQPPIPRFIAPPQENPSPQEELDFFPAPSATVTTDFSTLPFRQQPIFARRTVGRQFQRPLPVSYLDTDDESETSSVYSSYSDGTCSEPPSPADAIMAWNAEVISLNNEVVNYNQTATHRVGKMQSAGRKKRRGSKSGGNPDDPMSPKGLTRMARSGQVSQEAMLSMVDEHLDSLVLRLDNYESGGDGELSARFGEFDQLMRTVQRLGLRKGMKRVKRRYHPLIMNCSAYQNRKSSNRLKRSEEQKMVSRGAKNIPMPLIAQPLPMLNFLAEA